MRSAPFLIDSEQQTQQLARLQFNEGFSEKWLQERLFQNPQSLPFGEINPGFSEVVPLCMEMNTPAGPIDIVYVTPQGKVIIVETKLWRNPEARRKVIGQILDYAKEMQTWSYSDLQREVSRRTGRKGNVPFEMVQTLFPGTEESEFVDGVSNALVQGDFMLVIAGDGIRSDMEAVVHYLDRTANMKFTLAMVETAVYQTQDKSLTFVQPRTLFKTKEVERVIYVSEFGAEPEKEVETQAPSPLMDKYREFWIRLISSLQLDDPEQPLANPTARGNIYFPMPPKFSVAWLTVYFLKAESEAGCFLRLAGQNELGKRLYKALKEDRTTIEAELPMKVVWDDKALRISSKRKVEGEWPPLKDESVLEYFSQTVNAFVNTFRPRLERLAMEEGCIG